MEIYKPAEEVIYADKVEDELCVEKGRIENEEQWTNERPLNEVKWSCKLWKNPKVNSCRKFAQLQLLRKVEHGSIRVLLTYGVMIVTLNQLLLVKALLQLL